MGINTQISFPPQHYVSINDLGILYKHPDGICFLFLPNVVAHPCVLPRKKEKQKQKTKEK